jgi:hypothetical protein
MDFSIPCKRDDDRRQSPEQLNDNPSINSNNAPLVESAQPAVHTEPIVAGDGRSHRSYNQPFIHDHDIETPINHTLPPLELSDNRQPASKPRKQLYATLSGDSGRLPVPAATRAAPLNKVRNPVDPLSPRLMRLLYPCILICSRTLLCKPSPTFFMFSNLH